MPGVASPAPRDTLLRCLWFLRAAQRRLGRHGRGRVVLLWERGAAAQPALESALARLVEAFARRGRALGLGVCGLAATPALTRQRVLALLDAEQPPRLGWGAPP
jgi:hypothetical protein